MMPTDADGTEQSNPQHGDIRLRYEEQLDEIRSGLVEMTSLVLENTRRAGTVVIDSISIAVARPADAVGLLDTCTLALHRLCGHSQPPVA